ncbi:MAG: DUF5668 domain-containing protein [Anaerolineales bacterium]|nr:DUF5668 domain-containing protein [Anaerolineales bacterium]
MTQTYRHGGIVGPTMLIGIGAVLLMDNLGRLGQSPWTVLLDLWPIILVAAGLDLAIGYRSLAGAVLAAVLSLVVLAGAIGGLADRDGLPTENLAAEVVQVQLNGVASAKVTLAPLAASLRVGSLQDDTLLLAGKIYSHPWERVGQAYLRSGNTARVKLQTTGASLSPTTSFAGTTPAWDLGLTPAIPLDIEVSLVAGEANLPMGDLTAESLKVELVFGQSTVVLPANGKYDARLSGVFGQTVVVIPAGLEASVRLEPLLTGRTIDSDLRQLPDGRYVTAGYGQAENQVDLVISQVVGAIEVLAE